MDTRERMEARAAELGVTFSKKISDDNLAMKIAAAEAKAAKPATQKVAVVEGAVQVTGPKAGRWRAGIFFTQKPRILTPDGITEDQFKMIEADPMLQVGMVPADGTEPG